MYLTVQSSDSKRSFYLIVSCQSSRRVSGKQRSKNASFFLSLLANNHRDQSIRKRYFVNWICMVRICLDLLSAKTPVVVVVVI